MTQFKQLANVHQHSDSSLDGAATVDSLIKRTKELDCPYLALTDHGNMNSLMHLYSSSKKAGIKPILGIELYMQPPFIDEITQEYIQAAGDTPKIRKKLREMYVHLTVHFKDEWAFEYFSSLTPKMEQRAVVLWGETKPIATLEEVAGAAGHITVCSSCLVGVVQKYLLVDRVTGKVYPERATKSYHLLRDLVGKDDFFVEVFPHEIVKDWVKPTYDKATKQKLTEGYFKPNECTPWFPDGDLQKKANQFVLDLAKQNGDKVVISLDSHFAYPEQQLVQESKLGNGLEQWKFSNSYHILTTQEAAKCLKHTLDVSDRDIEEWVDNSYYWASKFDNFKLKTNEDRWVLPPLDLDWMKKLKLAIDRHGRMKWDNPVYVARLKEEIDLFTNNGKLNLMPYFFTVEDIANFCREAGILMTSRGSAGGSLMLYVLGVSATDPILYGLSLPRFLTLGRINENVLPDVDMDFGRKDEVLDYLRQKYEDRFAPISIDVMLKIKSSIKDAERSLLGEVRKSTEDMCKKLPTSPQRSNEYEFVFGGKKDVGIINEYQELKDYSENLANKNIWDTVVQMLGVQRQKSQHPCGVVIADKPIQEYVPLIRVGKGESLVTGFNPKWVEERGLLKFDVLGVNTLYDIEECLNLVKKRHNKTFNPWDLPYNAKVFEEFGRGNTVSVFQFDSATVVPLLKKTKPMSIPELSNITALGRPGTLDALDDDGRTLAEVYCARAQGEKVRYIHPDMEQITGNSFGIALYQEQTLAAFKLLAGYSDGETERARRAIGKKDPALMVECLKDLHIGCKKRGWSDHQVDLLVQQIKASSNYSFNKSHSTSYAQVAYACMWLKCHFPIEWWASVLSHSTKDDIISKFWKDVKKYVTLPDINLSEEDFVIKDNKLVAPLGMIIGVGPAAYHQLVANKPYKDFRHFIECHFKEKIKGQKAEKSAVHSGIAHKLIVSGVLDSLMPESDMEIEHKIKLFETVKAQVKKEKRKPEDSYYSNYLPLGKYLAKKAVIHTYFEDLRSLILIPRGGKQLPNDLWVWTKTYENDGHKYNKTMTFVDGPQIEKLMANAHKYKDAEEKIWALAYITEETYKKYQNNTKQFTRLIADINGSLMELIYWPPWGENVAPTGFKKMVVVVEFTLRKGKLNVSSVEHTYRPEDAEKPDVQ